MVLYIFFVSHTTDRKLALCLNYQCESVEFVGVNSEKVPQQIVTSYREINLAAL